VEQVRSASSSVWHMASHRGFGTNAWHQCVHMLRQACCECSLAHITSELGWQSSLACML
jgi:hypothetical protein